MPLVSFSRDLTVACHPARTWDALTDIPRLVRLVSIAEAVTELEPLAHYRATLQDKIGMFSLRADLDIIVSDVEPGRSLRARAVGQDRQVGARITIDGSMSLADESGGTRITVAGSYEVTGRVATLGASSIRSKGDKLFDEFFTRLVEELAPEV